MAKINLPVKVHPDVMVALVTYSEQRGIPRAQAAELAISAGLSRLTASANVGDAGEMAGLLRRMAERVEAGAMEYDAAAALAAEVTQ